MKTDRTSAKAGHLRLLTGDEVPVVAFEVIWWSLTNLIETDPMGLGELVAICRNPLHRLMDDYATRLAKLGLIDTIGQPYPVSRQIVLAACVGEGQDTVLIYPVLH